MDSISSPGRIKVRVDHNEAKVPEFTGKFIEEVHAYTVYEIGGEKRKWTLVPEDHLHLIETVE